VIIKDVSDLRFGDEVDVQMNGKIVTRRFHDEMMIRIPRRDDPERFFELSIDAVLKHDGRVTITKRADNPANNLRGTIRTNTRQSWVKITDAMGRPRMGSEWIEINSGRRCADDELPRDVRVTGAIPGTPAWYAEPITEE